MMTRFHRILGIFDFAALVPSVFISLIHFKLSCIVQPYSNEAFQHWFDTGEKASGSLAAISAVDALLSVPIPTVLLAHHPSSPLPFEWWIATAANSLFWGGFVYALFGFSKWIGTRVKNSSIADRL